MLATNLTDEGQEWHPMRIKFGFGDMSGVAPPKAEQIRTSIVPKVVSFWETALRVQRKAGPILATPKCGVFIRGHCVSVMPRQTCGTSNLASSMLEAVDVYTCPPSAPCTIDRRTPSGSGVSDADFVLLVTAKDSEMCRGVALAHAGPCERNADGRPTIGFVNICPLFFANKQPAQLSTMIHEVAHTLGFTADWSRWKSAPVRTVPSKRYVCRHTGVNGAVQASFSQVPRPFHQWYSAHLPAGFVESISVRGFGNGVTCRCPVDPSRRYSNEDLNDCLNNVANCAFAAVSPAVKSAARDYFGCDTIQGREFENSGSPRCNIVDPHWKTRFVHNELMTPTSTSTQAFISPMTFAFLQDSGWYQVDYSRTTRLVEGAFWGFKEGCGFVHGRCPTNTGSALVRPPKVCANGLHRACSADALGVAECQAGQPPSNVPRHQWLPSPFSGTNSLFDYCPVFIPFISDLCTNEKRYGSDAGPSSRCVLEGTVLSPVRAEIPQPVCRHVSCINGGSEYEIWSQGERVGGETCKAAGQRIRYATHQGWQVRELVCSDPRIVCAGFNYPHIPKSYLNRVPSGPAVPAGIESPPIVPHQDAPVRFNSIPPAAWHPCRMTLPLVPVYRYFPACRQFHAPYYPPPTPPHVHRVHWTPVIPRYSITDQASIEGRYFQYSR